MIIVILRSYSLKKYTCIVLLASLLLSTYYVYYVHKIRPTIIQKNIININIQEAFTSNKTFLKQCPKLEPSSADISTGEVFRTFEFEPIWLSSKSFWNEAFETRYQKVINSPFVPPLKVILVPHSHNDPGWLETYIYYYNTQTSKILNNIIEQLEKYQNMTFIWSEVCFLKTWWDTSPAAKRRALKQLIKSGRLEITTGGWVMADEATTHVYALVNQLMEGHQWLYRHLDVKPQYGWSVDVFGHSSTQAQLLALSGINATVIQRVHYAWKQWFADKRYGDFKWVPNWISPDKQTTILTHHQPFNLYTTRSCGPDEYICSQFEFDVENEEFLSNINENNIKSFTEQLLEQYTKTGSLYDHNVILVPLGCDFCYKDTREWELIYDNYNKIIKFINSNRANYSVDIEFGTVKTYFKEMVNRKVTFPILRGDFFVYADLFETGLPAYWSGYYTTRPSLKILDRTLEAKLRCAEILYTMASYHPNKYNFVQLETLKNDFTKIIQVRQALALFQHHDSITGTSKSFVMKDNAMKLLEAIYEITGVQKRSVQSLLFPNDILMEVSDESMWSDLERLSKQTVFRVEKGSVKKITFFNPLAQTRIQFVKILISNVGTKVRDHLKKKEIPVQISPVWEYYRQGTSIFIAPDKFELSFFVELPPMALITYELFYNSLSLDMPVIYSNRNLSQAQTEFEIRHLRKNDIQLENLNLVVRFNGSTGFIKSIYNKKYKRLLKCFMEIGAYSSVQYLSGAYIFQPEINNPQVQKLALHDYKPIIHVVLGRIYNELTVIYEDFLINSVRLYNSNSYLANAIHIENAIDFGGPAQNLDIELFMRFNTDIDNFNPPIFYTDSNGFHVQKRVYVENAGVAGNYFPITTMAYLEDKRKRLSLLTNHAQGAASLRKGSLEVMLDRRIVFDDDRGLNEGVTDNTRIINDFWLIPEYHETVFETFYSEWANEISKPSIFANHMSNSLNYPVSLFSFAELDMNASIPIVKLIQDCFPCDVHVVTLRVQGRFKFERTSSKNAFLILHKQGYTCKLKQVYKCTNFDFKEECGFDAIKIKEMVPMSLTGLNNQGNPFVHFTDINLLPMSIQTYNITFQ